MLQRITRLAANCAVVFMISATVAHAATKVTIATINNGDMLRMQALSDAFERQNPDIELDWLVMEETVMRVMRDRFTDNIERGASDFDVMTIGTYEVPIWAKNGWLAPLAFHASYDEEDLLKPIRDGLSYEGNLYAAPFYGESSMMMYRTDLFQQAGLTMPDEPTWDQVRDFAATLHDPDSELYGICLRGLAGWGENMALITTLANSFGARWFDMDWNPEFDSESWRDAAEFYVDLLRSYGPPVPTANGFNQNLQLFRSGKCAMWIDATVAAGYVTDPEESSVAGQVDFAHAPHQATRKGANWLWSWALAIPASSPNKDAATRFIAWATSREYTELVARRDGWAAVPPGTRSSLYENSAYRRAAPFADRVLAAIESADPIDNTLEPSPYVGVQLVAIPEFEHIGDMVGQQFSAALAGNLTVSQALENAQRASAREMEDAGY